MKSCSIRRIAIWTHPRTLSTVLGRCLAGRDDTVCFHEPFGVPFVASINKTKSKPPTISDHSFSKVKTMLEDEYPAKPIIAFKDMAKHVVGRFNQLPEGFTHTFLIREPTRSFLSFYKLTKNTEMNEGFQELLFADNIALFDLHQYVTQKLKHPTVIMDAYDLSHHPEKMLKMFCQKVDIPFKDNMINWETGNFEGWHPHWKNINFREHVFGRAINSSRFEPLLDKDEQLDSSFVHVKHQEALAKSKENYQILYEKCFKPSDFDK